MTLYEFHVEGVPQPQGSKKAYVVRGHAVVVDDNKDALRDFRARVMWSARASHVGLPPVTGAVSVAAMFWVPRGVTVRREWPSVKPDVDKYARALLDGITDSGLWKDDGQVVDLSVSKRYGTPGVDVTVEVLEKNVEVAA